MPVYSTRLGLPSPLASEAPNGPAQLLARANVLDPLMAIDAQGAFAARPVSTPATPGIRGRYYFATDQNVLYRDNGTGWNAITTPSAGGPVTTLPASPFDGQEVYFLADSTAGVVWHLRYRAASVSASKWEFLGGSPMTAELLTGQATGSATYVDLTTVGPTITLPLAGDYEITVGLAAVFQSGSNTVTATAFASYTVGATAASEVDAARALFSGDGNGMGLAHRTRVKLGLGAVALTAKYRTSVNTAVIANRSLSVRPIRVT